MFFDLICPDCGCITEVVQSADELDEVVGCQNPDCQAPMTRRRNRLWSGNNIAMHGNCTGGGGSCQWAGYYDPVLGTEINGKEHRRDLMKAKNLEEYYTDPDVDKHTDELKYIRSHSHLGDAEANAEADKCVKAAANVQRKKNIDAVFDRAPVD